MKSWMPAALAAALLSAPAMAQDYAGAVAAADRPAEARPLDAGRKPAEVLGFLGLKPGMTAADVMAGTGYYSEIMARVVGPKGKVIAYEPAQFYEGEKPRAVWAELTGRIANVTVSPYPFDRFAAPASSLDFTLLHLVYHDLYWQSEKFKVPRTDPAAFLKVLYAATKPGGIVGVIDHVGPAGDTRATVEKLHRIDPAVIKADFAAAGFKLEAESPVLRIAEDDHSKMVFDPAIRGKTDRVVYRFRKAK